MKRVLITGGIGSGKSFVIGIMNAMGFPSYDSDSRVKELYEEDKNLLAQIRDIVGDDVVVDGHLHKKRFAELIFNDTDIKNGVEGVVFPAIISDFEKWCSNHQSDIVILESAIALEKSALKGMYDEAVVVTAPEDLRISRAMARDNSSREQVLSRMTNQWSDEQRNSVADYIIENDGVVPLLPQIERYVNRR